MTDFHPLFPNFTIDLLYIFKSILFVKNDLKTTTITTTTINQHPEMFSH